MQSYKTARQSVAICEENGVYRGTPVIGWCFGQQKNRFPFVWTSKDVKKIEVKEKSTGVERKIAGKH